MDKEYIVLNEIGKNSNITQRELSKRTKLSLGSVNLLLNKMAREGLIKIKQIPMNRVAYMLTPDGMAEKIRKTASYIKNNYNYINSTKSRVADIIDSILEQDDIHMVQILIENDEISQLVQSVVQGKKRVVCINDITELNLNQWIIVVNQLHFAMLERKNNRIVNLLELI